MANLDVQRKKRNPLGWILFLLVALIAAFFLIRSCDSEKDNAARNDAASTNVVAATQPDWGSVDFNAARATDADVTDPDVIVSGNDDYTIYTLGENILFATDQSQLQGSAEAKLKQIVASLNNRFKGASIGVYGSTDSEGSASHNKELGAQRATAVKDWLANSGGVDGGKISVQSFGETKPVASNATEAGKQQNRNVSIVAFKNK